MAFAAVVRTARRGRSGRRARQLDSRLLGAPACAILHSRHHMVERRVKSAKAPFSPAHADQHACPKFAFDAACKRRCSPRGFPQCLFRTCSKLRHLGRFTRHGQNLPILVTDAHGNGAIPGRNRVLKHGLQAVKRRAFAFVPSASPARSAHFRPLRLVNFVTQLRFSSRPKPSSTHRAAAEERLGTFHTSMKNQLKTLLLLGARPC